MKNDITLYKQYSEAYIKNQYGTMSLLAAIISDELQPDGSVDNEYIKAYWEYDKLKSKKLIIKVKTFMDNNPQIKSVIVLSGGMDSTTLLYKLLAEGKQVKAISFNYGQRHKKELEYAAKTCEKLGVEHKVVDMTFLTELVSNSSLTGKEPVPHGHYEDETMKKTVVPNRNMIMASIAIGWAVNEDYDEVVLGVHAGDHAIYPDCRPKFVGALRYIAECANFKPINIYTPFLDIDKGDIAIQGKELNVDYSLAWTCYEGGEKPCGLCGACQERAEAFLKAGITDPLVV